MNTNRQVTGVQNFAAFTPQASYILAPQQTQPVLKPQPIIAAINPQIPQMQPVYIIANPNPGLPMMYPYNPMMALNHAPVQYGIVIPQTFRQNTVPQQSFSNQPVDFKPPTGHKPAPPERQKTKEVTLLYRYQKPITVDGLKHPSDKYKELRYRPKFITSRNIEPPTEELVPKLDEGLMTPLVDVKSRLNITPASTRRPKLVGDLKLPVEKVEEKSTNRLPVLVEELKLPIEKQEPEPQPIRKNTPKPEPEPKPQPIRKNTPKPELEPEPIKVYPKYKSQSKIDLNYVGKFHYPPEIDHNDAAEIDVSNIKYERLDDLNNYRPKSAIVKVSVEKETFELAKILFNPNVMIEFNQLIETKKLSEEEISRPKSSKAKPHEEQEKRLSKALKNVQEVHENVKMEQSTENENFRVPSRQSLKTYEHTDSQKVIKRALSNAFQVSENVEKHEAKIEENLKVQEPQKAIVKIVEFINVKNRAKNNIVVLGDALKFTQVKQEPLLLRDKSENLLIKKIDKLNVNSRVLFLSREFYENIKFENLNLESKSDDIESLKMKPKYKTVDLSEINKYLIPRVTLRANQIHLDQSNVKFNEQTIELIKLESPNQIKITPTTHSESQPISNRAYLNALQLMETIESNETKHEPGLVRDKSQIIESSFENKLNVKNRVTFNPNEMIEHQLDENTIENTNLEREKSFLATERIHSGNLTKILNEKAFYESRQVMENVNGEDLIESENPRPQSSRLNVSEHKESFEDQSSEKFLNELPVRTDFGLDEDDSGDEVEIEQYEAKQKSPKKRHDHDHHHHHHHFNFNGGNRICCSAHRKHDPYFHIESKVKSFENFGFIPQHSQVQIFTDRSLKRRLKNLERSKKHQNLEILQVKDKGLTLPKIKDDKGQSIRYDGYHNVLKYPDGSLRIFSENLEWNGLSKVGQLSFENINYKNNKNNIEVFSEKLNWNKESKIKAISELDLSTLNTHRSSQMFIFHDLPKWKDLVDSKVKSFENFHYRPPESSLKIYNEKIRWNSESRLKSYFQNDESKSQTRFDTHRDNLGHIIEYRPEWYSGPKQDTFNVYYKKWPSESKLTEEAYKPVTNQKLNWNVESKLKAISWENIKYKPQTTRKHKSKQNNIKPIPEIKNKREEKVDRKKKKKPDLAEIWKQEYKRLQQENKQQQRNNQLNTLKNSSTYQNKMETPDHAKISSRQSMSKYRELPPIKSGKENHNLELFEPWNLNSNSQRSFSRMFNPDVNDQNQKRFKFDADLKRRTVDQMHNNSRISHYTEDERNQTRNQFGTELINDLKLPRLKSPNRKSTPDTTRVISNLQTPSVLNTTFDQQSVIQERKITKRSKQPKNSNGKESKLSKQFEPHLDGFQLQGATLKIEGDAKVRPLANMSYKNAEETAKIRATSRLYSSLMTPRSFVSNDNMNYLN